MQPESMHFYIKLLVSIGTQTRDLCVTRQHVNLLSRRSTSLGEPLTADYYSIYYNSNLLREANPLHFPHLKNHHTIMTLTF